MLVLICRKPYKNLVGAAESEQKDEATVAAATYVLKTRAAVGSNSAKCVFSQRWWCSSRLVG